MVAGVVNWKTTIIAILTAVFGLVNTLGIFEIPVEVREAIITLAVFMIGLLAADAQRQKKG